MDNLNFNKWLADLKNDFPKLIKTVKQTIQDNEHLPNLQSFLYWFIDRDKGFYKSFILDTSKYTPKDKIRWMPLADYSNAYDYLIKKVDKKLNNYSTPEKKAYSKILADFFNEERTKKDDNYLGWAFSTFLDFYDFDGFVYGLETVADYYDFYCISINNNAHHTPQQIEYEPPELEPLTNNFDHKPINKVYDYFYRELVKENKYLTKNDLMQYLKLAFDEKKKPKQKFTFQNDPRKGEIINIFYRYYVDVNGRVTKKQKCCELLGKYFTGYTTSKVFNNFNK